MDNQGFAPTSAVKATLKHAPHSVPHAPARTPTLAQGGVVGARAINTKDAKRDAAIAKAETVRSIANFPFMLMMPGMVGIGVGKLAGWMKRDRTNVVLEGTGEALMNGVRKTPLNKPLHLAADVVETIGEKAAARGGRAAPWAISLNKRSVALREGADQLATTIGKITAPVTGMAGKGLEAVGMKEGAGKLWGKLGRYPLFAGIATVAAGAGITSIWLTRSKQSAEGKEALASLTAQLGANHAVTQAAAKVYSKQQTQTVVSSVLSSAGEALFVPFEANLNLGGAAAAGLMGAQMGLPSVGQLIVSENAVLDAYAKLQAMEQGKLHAEPGQKAYCLRQLMGAMPQVAEKGGVYNRLNTAMATALVKENASLADVVGLMGDPKKFSEYSVKVAHAQQAAPPAEAKTLAPSHDSAAPAMAMPKTHEVPLAKIQAATAANDGVVQAHQRQVG